MRKIMELISKEDGATALEYGLIASLIAAAIVFAVSALGTKVSETFTYIAGEMPDQSTTT
jgi:pilus assembly protein Flp/PilA